MGKQRFVLVVVGAYLWVMLILFGSIVLDAVRSHRGGGGLAKFVV